MKQCIILIMHFRWNLKLYSLLPPPPKKTRMIKRKSMKPLGTINTQYNNFFIPCSNPGYWPLIFFLFPEAYYSSLPRDGQCYLQRENTARRQARETSCGHQWQMLMCLNQKKKVFLGKQKRHLPLQQVKNIEKYFRPTQICEIKNLKIITGSN